MARAFAWLGADLCDDARRPVRNRKRAFALPKVLFRTATASGDCCTPRLPWGGLDVIEFIERAASADVDGVTVRYLALEDLIAMRRVAGRPKDLRRAAELVRIC